MIRLTPDATEKGVARVTTFGLAVLFGGDYGMGKFGKAFTKCEHAAKLGHLPSCFPEIPLAPANG